MVLISEANMSDGNVQQTKKPLQDNAKKKAHFNTDSLLTPDLKNHGTASTLDFNEKVKQKMKSGQKVYHFGFGQSPFPIMDEMVEALKENVHQTDYEPWTGRDVMSLTFR